MKRVVMPVRWQCAKCRRWYCGNQPCPWCWRAQIPLIFLLAPSGQPTVCHHFLTDSSFPSSRQSLVFVSYRAGVDVRFPCVWSAPA
ncbi:hypothetical protein [Escherichia coli]|uniref:hypothetical protein n=1 Tax=Escherichia coli TaxID=562 RepID=UPI000AED68CF|nr:hypothetical protein [Escherichia coli]